MGKSKGVTIVIISLLAVLMYSYIVFALFSYYDPNSTILSGWSAGTGTTYTEVVDTARQPTAPSLASYIASRSNTVENSQFGFPNVTAQSVNSTTLWVYTGTENNAQYTFELRQGTTTVCSTFVPTGSANAWRSCTWNNPSGALDSLSFFTGDASRPAGGAPNNAYIYAVYLEVYENIPPEVTLSNPENNSLTNGSPVNFEFIATDRDNALINECTLYGNFSGTWQANNSVLNVDNNTLTSIFSNISDGVYVWNVECTNSYSLSSFSSQNFTVEVDNTPPIVTLITPEQNAEEIANNQITFQYNVSDYSTIQNCSLVVNNTILSTTTSPLRDTTLSFSEVLSNDFYIWSVSCFDSVGNQGESEQRNLSVDVYSPEVKEISLAETIMLNAGSTKTVMCNASVEDRNGFEDIALVNATFFNEQSTGIDNKSNHYTNTSCNQISSSGNTADYECSFSVLYYADNGTWTCNVTATDNQSFTGTNTNTTLIDTLFALNISQSIINYGEVEAGFLSNEIPLNISNIGNQNINVDVRGFGGQNEVTGQGVAMICDSSQNISLTNKRYSDVALTNFELKNNLTATNTFTGIQVQKQNNEISQIQNIFWQLRAPPGPVLENCLGTVVFTASTS